MLFIAPVERVKEGINLELLHYHKHNDEGYYRYWNIRFNKSTLKYEVRVPQRDFKFSLESGESLRQNLVCWSEDSFKDDNLLVDYYGSLRNVFNVVTSSVCKTKSDYIYFVSSLEDIKKEFERYECSHTIVYKVLGENMNFQDILKYLN